MCHEEPVVCSLIAAVLYRTTVELLTNTGEIVSIQRDICQQQIGDVTGIPFPVTVMADVDIVENTVVSRNFSYEFD